MGLQVGVGLRLVRLAVGLGLGLRLVRLGWVGLRLVRLGVGPGLGLRLVRLGVLLGLGLRPWLGLSCKRWMHRRHQ